MVGPVPLLIQFMAGGELGAELATDADISNLASGNLGVMAGLQATAKAYLKMDVGVNLLVIKAGVGGQLDIVDLSLPLMASAELSPPMSFCAGLDMTVSLIGGRLYAFVEVLNPVKIFLGAVVAIGKAIGQAFSAVGNAIASVFQARRRRRLDSNHYLDVCSSVRFQSRLNRKKGAKHVFQKWRHEGNGCCISKQANLWEGKAKNRADCQKKCDLDLRCGSISFGWSTPKTWCTLQYRQTLVEINGDKDKCDKSGANKVKCYSHVQRQCFQGVQHPA